ncbi:MAG: hypothetical protein ACD_22C00083G0008 [uncultured bacterium]|nr:MAG: hypothetical protein ACD_22C00083G0008 [uncultured bacterium]
MRSNKPITNFNIERTDIAVVFSELNHVYISEELFKKIVELEKDKFGTTLIRDPNPQHPFLQLTLPKSGILIQVLDKKLVISDNSRVLPKDSELIKRYFASVYYSLRSVPCEPIAFGFNYGIVIQNGVQKLDTALGISTLSKGIRKDVDSYNISFGFKDGTTKYSIFVNTVGNTRKLQLNAHIDSPDLLVDKNKIKSLYEENWDYFVKFYQDFL